MVRLEEKDRRFEYDYSLLGFAGVTFMHIIYLASNTSKERQFDLYYQTCRVLLVLSITQSIPGFYLRSNLY